MPYIGRFAPSPTGPLHLGSLYAALASFLHARANKGQWLLRIDDVDHPREAAGATESIFNTLQSHGLHWDGEIDYQSRHLNEYQNIIDELIAKKLVYPCYCSRKTLLASDSQVYSGTCLHTPLQQLPSSLRVKSTAVNISFTDELQGKQSHAFSKQYGDFIIRRKDHITAYQLAVVIDDHRQNITHVVRGYDLLDSTAKQIFLQNMLVYKSPYYCHFPVIIDPYGNKLSKQKCAQAVSTDNPENTLFCLLTLLQQKPPKHLKKASVQTILNWGINNWKSGPLNNIHTVNY